MDEIILINGLKTNNKALFDVVFTCYYAGLCAYARRWVMDSQAAEDLVQDFFVRLWMEGSNLKINSSLKSYLFASVRNSCLNYLKHNQVKKQYELYVAEKESQAAPSADWYFTETELAGLIEQAMLKLPPRCREAFRLSRFEGKDNATIAQLMGISVRTVELQISKALKRMRIELIDFLPEA